MKEHFLFLDFFFLFPPLAPFLNKKEKNNKKILMIYLLAVTQSLLPNVGMLESQAVFEDIFKKGTHDKTKYSLTFCNIELPHYHTLYKNFVGNHKHVHTHTHTQSS